MKGLLKLVPALTLIAATSASTSVSADTLIASLNMGGGDDSALTDHASCSWDNWFFGETQYDRELTCNNEVVVTATIGGGKTSNEIFCHLDVLDSAYRAEVSEVFYHSEFGETCTGSVYQIDNNVRIEAEDYSAYLDSGAGNNGGEYRNDDVDIGPSSDIDDAYSVGWIRSGEWLEYTIDVEAGVYVLNARYSAPRSSYPSSYDGRYKVLLDGELIATHSVLSTGSWDTWATIALATVQVENGQHTLRVEIEEGSFNLNWFQLNSTESLVDWDGDGVSDIVDLCPATPLGAIVNEFGCEVAAQSLLKYSYSSDRSAAAPLDSATLINDGELFVFVDVESGTDITTIDFFIDGAAFHTEGLYPYDLAGSHVDIESEPALPFNLAELSEGPHQITVRINFEDGSEQWQESSFELIQGIVIYDTAENSAWPMWDSSYRTDPVIVTDEDYAHGVVAEFTVDGSAVMGFASTSITTSEPAPYDATNIVASGVVQFDLKVVNMPSNPSTTWYFKIESVGSAFAKFELSESIEGIAPIAGQWQTYTFNLSDLVHDGLDVSAIDILLMYPNWGDGDGTVYRVDNVKIF